MKHLFSYIDDAGKRTYIADLYITAKADPEQIAAFDIADKESDRLIEEEIEQNSRSLLRPIHYVMLACGFVAILLVWYLTNTYGSLVKGIEGNLPLTLTLIGVIFAAVICMIVDKRRHGEEDTVNRTPSAFEKANAEYERLYQEINRSLAVSEENAELLWIYTLPENTAFEEVPLFTLLEVNAWREGELLHLADTHARYTFKASDITAPELIKHPTSYLLYDDETVSHDKSYLLSKITVDGEVYAIALASGDEEPFTALLAQA